MVEVETTQGKWRSYTATLIAGTIVVNTSFQEVYDVVIQQNNGAPLAESFGWTSSDADVTLTSSNGASTAPLRILVRGRH